MEKEREREKRGRDHKTGRLTKITAIGRHGAIRIRLFGELLFLVPSFASGTIVQSPSKNEGCEEKRREESLKEIQGDTRRGRNDTRSGRKRRGGKQYERK